jgi:predicted house-cleaning noncanonical NTP pyrophosphatase (MazG superfamily)
MSTTLNPNRAVSLVDRDSCQALRPDQISVESVGEKAYGLACLPQEWTLPFFVISNDLAKSYLATQDASRGALVASWIENCKIALNEAGIHDDDAILVRSSAVSESIDERGKFHSISGYAAHMDQAIQSCLDKLCSDAELADERVYLIIQKELKPLSGKGHLSNERRCYEEARDWLGEFEAGGNSEGAVFTINLRNWRKKHSLAGDYGPLHCNLKAMVKKTLETAAAWGYLQKLRLHFEWVWDGKKIYIVQVDNAASIGGINPTKDPNFSQKHRTDFSPKCLVKINKEHAQAFNKIRNVFTYLDLNLPITNLYALDNEDVLNQLTQGVVPQDLMDDLSELVVGSLVIRIDLATEDKEKRQLLPRTHEVRDAEQASIFLKEKAAELRSRGITEKIIFIFHNFIPAVTSAFAYAAPGQRKVLIESLWGLPEGLYYNSHDKVTVDTIKPRMKDLDGIGTNKFVLEKVPRFKHFFVAPDVDGKWVTKVATAPWDWKFSITKDEWIKEIALHSRMIAEKEGRPLSIMWFIDVPKWASKAPIFPWYHEEFDYSQIKRPRTHRSKTPFDQSLLIQSSSDVEQLRKETNLEKTLVCQVKIRPKEEALLRNKALLKDVGELAKKINAVILLEGATLSHAYYQLMQTQAIVEVVHPFEEKEEVREFNKLVRDKIPSNIAGGGERVQITKLSGELLLRALRDKLVEEALEVLDAESHDSIIEELADVSEVIDSILVQIKASKKDLLASQKAKRDRAGGFDNGFVLLETTNPSPNVAPERKNNLPLDLGSEAEDESPFLSMGSLPQTSPILEKWADKRQHEKANELLLNLIVPITRDQWSADSAELNLGDSILRARIRGTRSGPAIQLELSLFTLQQQLKLDV